MLNYFTVLHQGVQYLINDKAAGLLIEQGAGDKVTKFELEMRPFTWEHSTKLANFLSNAGVTDATGAIADTESYEAARGGFVASLLLTKWNRKYIVDGVEADLPLTQDNIKSLPSAICQAISAQYHIVNRAPTFEEIMADVVKPKEEEGNASAPTTTNI